MHRAATSSLVLIDSSSAKLAVPENVASKGGLQLRALLVSFSHHSHTHQSFQDLAIKLIRLAGDSYSRRDIASVQEASSILLNLPIASAQQLGSYYQALTLNALGKKAESQSLLERIEESLPLGYKSRALQMLGTIRYEHGDVDSALRLYCEAARAASSESHRDLLALFLANLNSSFIRSDVEDHNGALTTLEKLLPLVRLIARQHPFYFYLYYNSLALAYGDLGRVAEGEKVIAVALNSPFALAYPEWTDTRDELAEKRQTASHSRIAVRIPQWASREQLGYRYKFRQRALLEFKQIAAYHRYSGIIVTRIILYTGFLRIILERLHRCSKPRSPPAHCQIKL